MKNKGVNTMKNNIGDEMKIFNNHLFSMSVDELNTTKDLINDLIKSKIKFCKIIFTINISHS